jgi:lysyl-tRNA synthetase class 2
MKRVPVDSTVILSAGYDPKTRTLEVQLQDGRVYAYLDVPPVVYRDLLAAESAGRYFAWFIKTTFCQPME